VSGPDVLIVNSRVDEAWSGWAGDVLRDSGRSVARLQDGLAGFLDVGQVIEREVRAAGQVVVLLSRTGSAFLAEAVSAANRMGKRVVPVHLDDRPAPYERRLAHLNAVDVTGVSQTVAGERLLCALNGSYAGRIRPNHLRRGPPAPDPFVGRDAELERLRAMFLDRPAVVVVGEEGVGKSALAAQFIRLNRGRWLHVLWSSPARFADDQLRAITRPRGPALLVIDGARDYRSLRDRLWPVLLDRDLVNVLVTSRDPDWPDPFRVLGLGGLDPLSGRRLMELSAPGLAGEWAELGANPGAVAVVARSGRGPGELAAVREIARAVRAGEHGFYFLDTEDPAVVAGFERVFLAVADDVELLSAGRGPWRRWWRRRGGGPREGSRQVPVGEVAGLLAAMRPVPRAVLNVDSTVFVKAPARVGPRIVTRTLTAGELREFEHSQRLRADPVAEALGDHGGAGLVERSR
jgi:AAA ATPase domain